MGGPLAIYVAEPADSSILIIAYAGWNDAGEAATTAAKSLLEQFSMTRYACIDTEDYLDFTVARPRVRASKGEHRELVWPHHEFFAVRLASDDSDLIVGLGVEPHLRWKSYCELVVELVRRARVRLVVLLGALLDEVIYSQPVQVGAYSSDPELAERFELGTPSYEGSTGIVGVLADTLRREGVPTASLWARIPHYVPTQPNARGALALLNAVEAVADLRLDLSGIEAEAAEFDEKVSQLIATNPELSAYVRELKKRVFSQ